MSWEDDLERWINRRKKRARIKKFKQLRRAKKPVVRPVWEPMQVGHFYQKRTVSDDGTVETTGSTTKVLYRNRRTGEVKIEELNGTWRLDAL